MTGAGMACGNNLQSLAISPMDFAWGKPVGKVANGDRVTAGHCDRDNWEPVAKVQLTIM